VRDRDRRLEAYDQPDRPRRECLTRLDVRDHRVDPDDLLGGEHLGQEQAGQPRDDDLFGVGAE